jgi:putative redox protein
MDMIALPEWSPNLIPKSTGWGGFGADISQEVEDLFCAAAGPRLRRSRWINHSNDRDLIMTKIREVVVAHDPTNHGALVGHVDASQFPIGGPDGVGHISPGPNPYDLLSASLAACTAMTVRFQARRQKLPLEGMEVGVSFHHGAEGERDSFERTLVLEGELDAQQRAFLLEAANLCPVGKILGISTDIHTRLDAATSGQNKNPQASYEDDLAEFQIPNVDPD